VTSVTGLFGDKWFQCLQQLHWIQLKDISLTRYFTVTFVLVSEENVRLSRCLSDREVTSLFR